MCFRIFKASTNGVKFSRRLLKRLQQGSDLENNGGMCAITSSTAQEKTIVHPTSSNPWCWQPWGCTVGNHVFSTALPMGKRNSGVVIFSDCQEETRHWKQIGKKNDKQKQKTKITNGKSWGLERGPFWPRKKKSNHNCNTLKRTAETRTFPQLSTTWYFVVVFCALFVFFPCFFLMCFLVLFCPRYYFVFLVHISWLLFLSF